MHPECRGQYPEVAPAFYQVPGYNVTRNPIQMALTRPRNACPEDFGSPSPDNITVSDGTPSRLYNGIHNRIREHLLPKLYTQNQDLHIHRPQKRQRLEDTSMTGGKPFSNLEIPTTGMCRHEDAIKGKPDIDMAELPAKGPYNLRSRQLRPTTKEKAVDIDGALWRKQHNRRSETKLPRRKRANPSGE